MKNLFILSLLISFPLSVVFSQSTFRDLFTKSTFDNNSYQGIVLKDTIQEFPASDCVSDLFENSGQWRFYVENDVVNSAYTVLEGELYVRIYLKHDINTGELISLKRNSSGNIYWWSETWFPDHIIYFDYKTNQKSLPARNLTRQEKNYLKMFDIVCGLISKSFTTGKPIFDSLLYICLEQEMFAKNMQLNHWDPGIFNSLFEYRFTSDSDKEYGKKSFNLISLDLLSGEYKGGIVYFTVNPFVTEKISNGFSMKTNPEFDNNKHRKFIETDSLTRDLLSEFY